MTKRWRGAVSSSAAALVIALAAGCNKDSPPASGGGAGTGNISSVTSVANGDTFQTPFDAAPSPDGTAIYFTGVDPVKGAAIFKVGNKAGSAPSVLTSGCATPACDSFVGSPLGIAVSSDGATVYVADPAYTSGASDSGSVFSVPSGGGSQTALAETAGYNARFITVSKVGGSDNLYLIGDDKADGQAGIFKDVGGTVTTVIKGGDPPAVAVASDGTVYYLDQNGSVQKVGTGGTATALGGSASNLAVSYPAGMALSQDEKSLLVPVFDSVTGAQAVTRIDVSSGAQTGIFLGLPRTNVEGGGLHRAANADVYSFVDSGAGSSGTIYLLK